MDILHIHRYLSNEASEKEERELEKWLHQSEENLALFRDIQRIYDVDIKHSDNFDVQTALSTFKKVMNEDVAGASSAAYKRTNVRYMRRKRKGVWLKVAAVLIIGMSLSLYAVIYSSEMLEKEHEEVVLDINNPTVIETSPGEQKSFRLKDGSRIRLNASSRIDIPADFGDHEREISLTGEAFFEITADPNQEFTVQTNSARISVLGTSFSIRAWVERDESIIAVENGVVSVRSATLEINEETILNAGEYSQIRTGEAPGPALQENFNQYLGWKNQVFVFEETPLKDVLHQLELHFNVRITVDDSTSIDDPVTARYDDETLSQILQYTSITHEVEFEVEPIN